MDAVPYPPAPQGVPRDLARPSGAFRLQAYAAVLGLVVFLAVYFGLAGWFGWIAYRGVRDLFDQPALWLLSAAKAFVGGFFCALMVKGVFFVRRTLREDLVEITEADEPVLFHFVRQVAREAGAPRPHRVFLSARVNAAVFYDVSLLNLIIPSRKNLEVGVGLINTLSLDEFKAVVAHEFGHFAQRTMSVGAWVYIAQQVVGAMVARRDIFDSMLDGLSRTDIRIAWIGWSMRLVVWSLRAVFDTAFRGLILLERALARQMEFQADLVSVSLTGSDSLVHALHRLGAADDAWDRAMGFSAAETHAERRVADLFAVQSRVLERMAVILDDPEHGRTPQLPQVRQEHRLFSSALADVPRMWSSHPPNHEREESAKRRYFPSPLDPRPAWLLFRDPDALRRRMTEHALSQLTDRPLGACVPLEESLGRLDEGFQRPRLDPRFRGAFLREPLVRHASELTELVELVPADPLAAMAAAYPAWLSEELDRHKELTDEKAMLEGLRDGFLVAPGGVIRFRGRQIRRKDLGRVIQQVSGELEGVQQRVQGHDRAARAAFRAAARRLGRGWDEHLAGLLALVHYAEHTEADLDDARGHVRHVVEIVTADERVSDSEMKRLIASGSDLAGALRATAEQRDEVRLPAPLLARLGVDGWEDMYPTFDLDDPLPQSFGEGWLGEMEQAVDVATGQLGRMRNAALDALVEAEAQVERSLKTGEDPGDAPAAGRIPRRYTRIRPGSERPRQKRLGWWDRFVTADGFVAGTARLAVASAILVPLLAFSVYDASNAREMVVHNGLGIPVHVAIGDEEADVPAHGEARLDVSPGHVTVRATTLGGEEIERFEAEAPRARDVVYNVAGASTLLELTMVYGPGPDVPARLIGAKRWVEHTAEFVFIAPPEQVRVEGKNAHRRFVRSLDDEQPQTQAENAGSPEATAAMALTHARFDPPGPALARWLELAAGHPALDELLDRRIAEIGPDVALARIQMDRASGDRRNQLCEAHAARAKARPEDPDALYLAVRCQPDGPAQDEAFLDGHRRFPAHPYLRYASAWVGLGHGEWDKALGQLEEILGDPAARESMGPQQLAELVARLRRVVHEEPAYDDLFDHMPLLKNMLELEAGRLPEGLPETADAFRHLGQGNLKEALWVRGLPPDDKAHLVRQVGASQGATREQIDAALGLPPSEGIGWATGLPAVALALREGRDAAPIWAALDKELGARFAGVLDAKRLAKDPAVLDRAVAGLDLRVRGSARVAGIVLLGKKAPAHWRKEARALLFAIERPYLAD